ncbi:MAG: TIGR00296 family protein [Candidatus Methanoperedens sp.]|nr:TIGR00296 family protein [Candidatus Methanoperedens sp.]
MLTIPEGNLAVRLARQAIEDCLRKGIRTNPKNPPPVFDKKRGVFVTIKKNNNMKELRGCIGRPYPVMPLKDAIIISAINAARDDNRFTPLTTEEIDEVVIEVTVLTVPKCIEVKPEDIPYSIEIGRHGLIVITGRYAGLLLPQVAVEHGFDSTEFLCQTCMKAGLMPDAWLEGAEVYLFEGQVFEETEPGGKVREKILSDGC